MFITKKNTAHNPTPKGFWGDAIETQAIAKLMQIKLAQEGVVPVQKKSFKEKFNDAIDSLKKMVSKTKEVSEKTSLTSSIQFRYTAFDNDV